MPRNDVKPPKEVVETVEVCWGEGLGENEFVLQGELDEACANPSRPPQDVDDGYEPPIFGDESEHVIGDPKESTNDGEILKGVQHSHDETGGEPPDPASDEPLDLDAQLQKEIEELSTPLKVLHVTLMEPIMSRGVQHVMPAMDRIMTRMKYMGI